MKSRRARRRFEIGFTLIEVMIALVVTSIGLLGLAKMQALAISSTKISGTRSLIAIHTASLASAMHANARQYWAASPPPAGFTTQGTTVLDPTGMLDSGARYGCTSACTPERMAASDVKTWVNELVNQFPSAVAAVACSSDPAANSRVTCRIAVTWSEKSIAMDNTTVAGVPVTSETFVVNVRP